MAKTLKESHLPEDIDLQSYDHLRELAQPAVEWKMIGILLALPVVEAHDVVCYHRGLPNEPYTIVTRLGTAIGPIGHTNEDTTLTCRVTAVESSGLEEVQFTEDEAQLRQILERSWKRMWNNSPKRLPLSSGSAGIAKF